MVVLQESKELSETKLEEFQLTNISFYHWKVSIKLFFINKKNPPIDHDNGVDV